MRKTASVSFAAATLLFLFYHGAWWLCRYYQAYWPTDLNILGFLMLLLASPWSSLLFSSSHEMATAFGQEGRQFVHAILLSIGLGINCAVIACLARAVFAFLAAKARMTR